MRISFARTLLAIVGLVALPALSFAQGSIAGVVRDTSGAVLPGVTVEASSPALIEKTRSVVTDAQGQYKIVDLRPGTYAVTFSLTGFATVRREELALSAAVTLPINAEMKVGAIEETITVSGATPVVDVNNSRQQTQYTRELLDAIPRTRDQALTAAALPGVTASSVQDAGGSGGVIAQLAIHGSDSGDQVWAVDGMKGTEGGQGARRVLVVPDSIAQEYTYSLSGATADTATGGVQVNVVPKEGGNEFKGTILGSYTGSGMVADNLTDAIKARGLTSVSSIDKVWDVSPAIGGPIVKDRLWFFTTYRNWGSNGTYAGVFFESDPTKPGPNPNNMWAVDLRLTFQPTPKNKVSVSFDKQGRDQPYRTSSATATPEASSRTVYPNLYMAIGRWTSPITSKLLLEAAFGFYQENQVFAPGPSWAGPGTYPHFEITTGKFTVAPPASGGLLNPNSVNIFEMPNIVANVSYVTGSHAFKFGMSDFMGCSCGSRTDYPPVLRYNNGAPFQVLLTSLPTVSAPRLNYDLGLYAQDQWTHKRLTLNLGVRFEFLSEQIDEQDAPGGTYVPARHFDAIKDIVSWKDASPRLGMSWDLFGTGKTAFKMSLNRYTKQEVNSVASSVNPLGSSTDTRTWTDPNRDNIPQLSELGPSTNLNFGLPLVTTKPTADVSHGWHKRVFNWELATSVQHQLLPGLAVSVGYYRRSYGNLTITQNTLISPSDFTPFTFTNPIDGERITGYNLNAAKRGQSLNIITFAPDDSIVYNGVDVNLNGKFGQGGVVNTGLSMGRTAYSTCTAGRVGDPNLLRFCDVSPGFFAQNQFKVLVAYPLPYGIRASGTFRSIAGPVPATGFSPTSTPGVVANYAVTSAIAGTTLTNGTVTVNLVEPGTQFGDRRNQVDFRLGKRLKMQSTQLELFVDFYNLFNRSTVLAENFTYGPAWRQPTDVLVGRMAQIGAQLNF